MFCLAAITVYSPSRPMWLQHLTLTQEIEFFSALLIARSMACFATSCPKPPAPVKDCYRGGLSDDFRFSTQLDLSSLDLIDIARQVNHAVGIVAHEVIRYEMGRDPLGFFPRGATLEQNIVTEIVKLFFGEDWHFTFDRQLSFLLNT